MYHNPCHPVGNYLGMTAQHLTHQPMYIFQKTVYHPHHQLQMPHPSKVVHLPRQIPHHTMTACFYHQSSFLPTPNVKCHPPDSWEFRRQRSPNHSLYSRDPPTSNPIIQALQQDQPPQYALFHHRRTTQGYHAETSPTLHFPHHYSTIDTIDCQQLNTLYPHSRVLQPSSLYHLSLAILTNFRRRSLCFFTDHDLYFPSLRKVWVVLSSFGVVVFRHVRFVL